MMTTRKGEPTGRWHPSYGSRIKSIEEGLDTYQAAKPCIRGHVSLRYVATRRCVECERLIVEDMLRQQKEMQANPGGPRVKAARYDVGIPCCQFGHTEGKWLRGNACVVCNRERQARKRTLAHIPPLLPAPGTANNTWHMISGEIKPGAGQDEFPALWIDGSWSAHKVARRTPHRCALFGWTYVKPI
jgi:hypothetical protein